MLQSRYHDVHRGGSDLESSGDEKERQHDFKRVSLAFAGAGALIMAGFFAVFQAPSVAFADGSPRSISQGCDSVGFVSFVRDDWVGPLNWPVGLGIDESTEGATETVHNLIRCWTVFLGYTDRPERYCARWEIREDPDGAGSSRVCVEWDVRIVRIPVYGQECEYVGHSHDAQQALIEPSGSGLGSRSTEPSLLVSSASANKTFVGASPVFRSWRPIYT